jgi:hypothetical protein
VGIQAKGIFGSSSKAAKEAFLQNFALCCYEIRTKPILAVAPGGSKTSGGFWPDQEFPSKDAGQRLFGNRNKKSWVKIIYKFMT